MGARPQITQPWTCPFQPRARVLGEEGEGKGGKTREGGKEGDGREGGREGGGRESLVWRRKEEREGWSERVKRGVPRVMWGE